MTYNHYDIYQASLLYDPALICYHFTTHKKSVKCEDKKWAIRSRKLKKENEYNAKKKDKRTNNDKQNTTQKPTDRTTRTSLKTRLNSSVPEG